MNKSCTERIRIHLSHIFLNVQFLKRDFSKLNYSVIYCTIDQNDRCTRNLNKTVESAKRFACNIIWGRVQSIFGIFQRRKAFRRLPENDTPPAAHPAPRSPHPATGARGTHVKYLSRLYCESSTLS